MRNKYGHTGLRMCIRTEATVEQGTTNHIHNIDAGGKVFTDYDFYFRTPVYKAWIELLFMLRIKISRFFSFIFIFFAPALHFLLLFRGLCVCVSYSIENFGPILNSIQRGSHWIRFHSNEQRVLCCVRGETKFVWRKHFYSCCRYEVKYMEKIKRAMCWFFCCRFHTQ